MEKTGLSQRTASALRAVTIKNVEDFADEQRGRLQDIAETLAKRVKDKTEDLTPMQSVIALGIVSDKINSGPKAVTQSLHLHIKGDANSALAAILGPAAKSVLAPTVNPVNISESLKIKPGKGDHIDVETAQQA